MKTLCVTTAFTVLTIVSLTVSAPSRVIRRNSRGDTGPYNRQQGPRQHFKDDLSHERNRHPDRSIDNSKNIRSGRLRQSSNAQNDQLRSRLSNRRQQEQANLRSGPVHARVDGPSTNRVQQGKRRLPSNYKGEKAARPARLQNHIRKSKRLHPSSEPSLKKEGSRRSVPDLQKIRLHKPIHDEEPGRSQNTEFDKDRYDKELPDGRRGARSRFPSQERAGEEEYGQHAQEEDQHHDHAPMKESAGHRKDKVMHNKRKGFRDSLTDQPEEEEAAGGNELPEEDHDHNANDQTNLDKEMHRNDNAGENSEDDDGDEDYDEELEDILEVTSQPEVEPGNGNKVMVPDHMAGVPVERDGHVNKNAEKEGFFGKRVHQLEEGDVATARWILVQMYQLADKDTDGQLNQDELANWIYNQTLQHYQSAQAENEEQFSHLDTDSDGMVRWTEYIHHVSHLKEDDVDRHAPHHLSKGIMREIRHLNKRAVKNRLRYMLEHDGDELSPLQRLLARDFERWRKADENHDRKLTPAEFLAFRHPEYCRKTLKQLATEVISEMDQNHDGELTMLEFTSPVGTGAEHGPTAHRLRRREFRENIDLDGNSVASQEEMEQYLDPRNKQQAVNKANALIKEADENDDGMLNYNEIAQHYHLFMPTGESDMAQALHHEL